MNEYKIENEQFNKSLDIKDNRIAKYIPFILQDIWALGSIPEIVSKLVLKNNLLDKNIKKVIDLGCGKGATIIELAKQYNSNFIGIDIVPEFIEEGNKILKNIIIKGKVELILGNIVDEVNKIDRYEIIIFGYDTEILGSQKETLLKLRNLLKPNGVIIFETAYRDLSFKLDDILTYDMLEYEIKNAGLFIKDKYVWKKDTLKRINEENNNKIKIRIDELTQQYPEEKKLFIEYYNNQIEETQLLATKLHCISFVLHL